MPDLFDGLPDPNPARKARDIGLARVTGNNERWMQEGIERIARLHNFTGIAEDFKHRFLEEGMSPPTSPNAWGALFRYARTLGLLRTTGNWKTPQDVPSHARPTQEYRRD